MFFGKKYTKNIWLALSQTHSPSSKSYKLPLTPVSVTYLSLSCRDFGNSVDELLDELEKSLSNVELNDDEMRCMGELRQYALGDEGSWVLSDEFLNLIGNE